MSLNSNVKKKKNHNLSKGVCQDLKKKGGGGRDGTRRDEIAKLNH